MSSTTPDELRHRLRATFAWRADRRDQHSYADATRWYRDPGVLAALGPALAGLHADSRPSVVLGVESSGTLLGPMAATALGAGFVRVHKDPTPTTDSDVWVTATAPPDYRGHQPALGFRRALVTAADRVLLVDDWIETGGQAAGARRLVDEVGATWVGVAVVVDYLDQHRTRRDFGVRALLRAHDLRRIAG